MSGPVEALAEGPGSGAAGPGILTLAPWADEYGVVAGITGAAAGDYGLHSSRTAQAVVEQWLALPRHVGGGFEGLVVSRQVHGNRVLTHRAGPGWRVFDGYDGHGTGDAGLLLAVSVADCIPVYLVAPGEGKLALVHAGWRGVAAGILERGIEVLGVPAASLTVHLGVGICGDCYEVGPEVVEALGLPPVTGPSRVDLRAVLADRALRSGVGRITRSPWCARHDRQFHSHRRDGAASGRMAAFLGRPSP